jgi:hypothetical protein
MYDGASGDAWGLTRRRDASVKVMLSHVCLGRRAWGCTVGGHERVLMRFHAACMGRAGAC